MDALVTAFAVLSSAAMPGAVSNVLILAASIFILSKASEFVVKNAISIGRATKVGELSTGFLMLSLATNVPEMAVAATALLSGGVDLSVGNILGSNIVNVGLVLALAAIIRPIPVRKGAFEKLPLMMFVSSMIPLAFLLESGMAGSAMGLANPGRMVGTVLLIAFVVFAFYSTGKKIDLKIGTGAEIERSSEGPGRKGKRSSSLIDLWKGARIPFKLYRHVAFLLAGMAMVVVSASFVVSSSVSISVLAGISPSLIGATIIAIGTSLPELSLSLTSVRTKHFDLALGNIIGSSLTKITLVLGILLFFTPGGINMGLFTTLLFFLIVVNALAWYFLRNDRVLDRNEGLVLIFVYIASLIAAFGVQLFFIG
jgi:cation:H+ antiporter